MANARYIAARNMGTHSELFRDEPAKPQFTKRKAFFIGGFKAPVEFTPSWLRLKPKRSPKPYG